MSGQTTYHVFKQGIKPTWEDPSNARGGAWIVRLRKGLAARFWEELLLAMVGEQFESGNEVEHALRTRRAAGDRRVREREGPQATAAAPKARCKREDLG